MVSWWLVAGIWWPIDSPPSRLITWIPDTCCQLPVSRFSKGGTLCPADSQGSFHSAHSGKRGIHLSSRGPFSSLYYIHNANFDFVNMESEIFSKKCWNDRPGTGDRWVSSMRTGGGFQLLAAGCQESWPACGAAITISQPGGQLSSGKRASSNVIFPFQGQSHRDSYCGEAANR